MVAVIWKKMERLVEFLPQRIHFFDRPQYEEQGVTHEVLPQNHVEEEQKNGGLEDRHSADLEEALFLQPLGSVHSIILDWTSACFIDSVGAKVIKQVLVLF